MPERVAKRKYNRRKPLPVKAAKESQRAEPLSADTAAVIAAADKATVQAAIDATAAAGDGLPTGRQMDRSNALETLKAADATDPAFEEQYAKSLGRSDGYLKQRKVGTNRTTLVPANCEVHPDLGAWGLRYMGRWMMIRWINIRPAFRQKRFEQGWQYFEGPVWARRLGLNPENYLNEKGRILTGDTELGWIGEEFVYKYLGIVKQRKDDMVRGATDRMLNSTSAMIPGMKFIEGSDDEVMGQIGEMKGRVGA